MNLVLTGCIKFMKIAISKELDAFQCAIFGSKIVAWNQNKENQVVTLFDAASWAQKVITLTGQVYHVFAAPNEWQLRIATVRFLNFLSFDIDIVLVRFSKNTITQEVEARFSESMSFHQLNILMDSLYISRSEFSGQQQFELLEYRFSHRGLKLVRLERGLQEREIKKLEEYKFNYLPFEATEVYNTSELKIQLNAVVITCRQVFEQGLQKLQLYDRQQLVFFDVYHQQSAVKVAIQGNHILVKSQFNLYLLSIANQQAQSEDMICKD